MNIIEMPYWKATAEYEDGTYIERFYTTNIMYIEIEDELCDELSKLFGECLNYDIIHMDGALTRYPNTGVIRI